MSVIRQVQPISFASDGLQLAGELHLPDGYGLPGVCICHGIPARPYDPEDRSYAHLAERFVNAGLAVLLFYFRGAGPSEGNFDIQGWTRDLRQALSQMEAVPQIDKTRLFVMGFSGGAAVALYTAAKDKRIAAVVSCASPADFRDLLSSRRIDDFLSEWRRIGIIRDTGFPQNKEAWARGFERIAPENHIGAISPRPVLLLHGDADEVVPVSHAYRLHEAAREPRKLVIIEGGAHRLRVDQRAMDKALEWLKRQSTGNPVQTDG